MIMMKMVFAKLSVIDVIHNRPGYGSSQTRS